MIIRTLSLTIRPFILIWNTVTKKIIGGYLLLILSFQDDMKEQLVVDDKVVDLPFMGITGMFLEKFFPLLNYNFADSFPDASKILNAYNVFLGEFAEQLKGSSFNISSQQTFSLFQKEHENVYSEAELQDLTQWLKKNPIKKTGTDDTVIDKFIYDNGEPKGIINSAIKILDSFINNEYAASLWLESLALFSSIYFWLSPKGRKTERKKPREMCCNTELVDNKHLKEGNIPAIMLRAFSAIDKYQKYYPEGLFNLISPFKRPDLWELLTRIFRYRLSNVSEAPDIRYINIPLAIKNINDLPYYLLKNFEQRYFGMGHKAELLLQLAWEEVAKMIDSNRFVKTCYLCGKPFPIEKSYKKTMCGDVECKRKYETLKRIRQKAQGIKSEGGEIISYQDYMRNSKQRSRERRKH